jgi:hypothetical protein
MLQEMGANDLNLNLGQVSLSNIGDYLQQLGIQTD